jgi:hypothetical protein
MVSQIQIEFTVRLGGRTQCDRILARLQASEGEWVPMPELALVATPTGIGTAVHSRIADLRKRGCAIDRRCERNEDGRCCSYYRLIAIPPESLCASASLR